MKLTMYSIQPFGLSNGQLVLTGSADTTINDQTNFNAKMYGNVLGPDVGIKWVDKASGQYPTQSGVSVKGQVIKIGCEVLGNPVDAGYDTLMGTYCPEPRGTRIRLVCKDTSDSNRQWYVDGIAKPAQSNGVNLRIVNFEFTVVSDTWYAVSTTTEADVSVTSSPKTWSINVAHGNTEVYPVIKIKPTGARGSGEAWNRFITIFNRTQNPATGWKIDITNGGLNTAAIIKVAATNTTSTMAGITASVPATGGTLTNLASTAAFPASGMVWYDNEQISYTSKTGTTLVGITRAIGGTTAATHANPTTVFYSKMLANGDDVKIVMGNGNGTLTEIPRWFGDSGTSVINNTATKIWVSLNIAARAFGTLLTAIDDGSGASPTIVLDTTEGSIPPSHGMFLIGSENVGYGFYRTGTKTASSLARGIKGTTAVAHSAGAVVRVINEMWMQYGDYTAGTHTQNDSTKPIISLANSTNSSWVYTGFSDRRYSGADQFSPSISGATAKNYTVDKDLNNNAPIYTPVADIGVSLTGKLETATWQANYPFGYDVAAFTGIDRFNLPANTAFFGDSVTGESVQITKTSAANAWQLMALTYNPAATRTNLQLYMFNAGTANFATRAAVNVGGLTVTMSTAITSPSEGVPSVTLGAEQPIEYHLACEIANLTTGETINLDFKMLLNQTLQIDTLARTITYLYDSSDAFTALQDYDPRAQWLRLLKGTNNMRYRETGATGVTITVSYQYRNTANG